MKTPLLLLFFILIQSGWGQGEDEENGTIPTTNGTQSTVDVEVESPQREDPDVGKTLANAEAAVATAEIELNKAREEAEVKQKAFEEAEEMKRNATQEQRDSEKEEMEAKHVFDETDREYQDSLEEWELCKKRLREAEDTLNANNTTFNEAVKVYNEWKGKKELMKDELRNIELRKIVLESTICEPAEEELREEESLQRIYEDAVIDFNKMNDFNQRRIAAERGTNGLQKIFKRANETFTQTERKKIVLSDNYAVNNKILETWNVTSVEEALSMWREAKVVGSVHMKKIVNGLEELMMIASNEDKEISIFDQIDRDWKAAELNLQQAEIDLNNNSEIIRTMEEQLKGVDLREMAKAWNEANINIPIVNEKIERTRRRFVNCTHKVETAAARIKSLKNEIAETIEMENKKRQELETAKGNLGTAQTTFNNIKKDELDGDKTVASKEVIKNEKNQKYTSAIQATIKAKANLDDAENALNEAKEDKIKADETLSAKNQAKIDADILLREKTEDTNKSGGSLKSGGGVILCVTFVHLLWK